MSEETVDGVGDEVDGGTRRMLTQYLSAPFTTLLFVVFAALPLVTNQSQQFLITEMMVFGLFALGFDFLYGYGGIVSFGQAAFYGLGAYMIAMMNVHFGLGNFWLLVAIAVLVPAVYALVVGYISIRTTGVYFAILTLAWAQITFILADNLTEITGGANGMAFTPPDVTVVPGLVEFSVLDPTPYYYLVFAFLLVSFLVLRRLTQSPFGAVLQGIRNNQERVNYLGYNERWYRIIAFVVSGGITGLAGALSVFLANFVSPSFMNFILSGEVIVWTIVGGKGTLVGPIIGAGLIHLLEDVLSTEVTWWFIPIGIFFIAIVIFMPNGIVGGLKRLRDAI
jgi:branched-chain amino acid transport system permease protein